MTYWSSQPNIFPSLDTRVLLKEILEGWVPLPLIVERGAGHEDI